MVDRLVEVLRVGAEVSLARMRDALTDEDPLMALWTLNSDLRMAALNTEFIALANHRKAIRAELKTITERVRDIETAAVTVALRARGSICRSLRRSRSPCSLHRPRGACATKKPWASLSATTRCASSSNTNSELWAPHRLTRRTPGEASPAWAQRYRVFIDSRATDSDAS